MTAQLMAPPPTAAAPRPVRKPGPGTYLWLVWRQHGGLVVSAVFLTLGLCTALLFAGAALSAISCQPDPLVVVNGGTAGSCGVIAQWHTGLYTSCLWLLRVTVFAPLAFGVFVGAPLVSREYEAGTLDLAWGQGLSARQWLLGKLIVLAGLGCVLSLAGWLCARPVATSLSRVAPFVVGGRFGWEPFSTLAPLAIPYTLAALAFGVLCSVALKQTLPAMALTAAVCLGLGMGTADLARPHYAPPKVVHGAIGDDAFTVTGDPLVLSSGWADVHGHPVNGYPGACDPDNSKCLNSHGIYSRFIEYQPGSRESAFQWFEGGLALLVAGLAGGVAVRRVRPHQSRRSLSLARAGSESASPAPALRPAPRRTGLASYLWLVWRQHGGLLVWTIVTTAAFCTALLLARSDLAATHCTDPWGYSGTCQSVAVTHSVLYQWSTRLLEGAVCAPALLGVFWGAPLVAREYERGTQDLAWGQGISARRWLAGKLAALALLTLAVAAPLWLCARPVAASMVRLAPDQVDGAFGWLPFAALSPLLVLYSLAALAVGALASVLLRRTIPAMVVAALVCVGLGLGATQVRPHYVTPHTAHATISLHQAGPPDAHNALYLDRFALADAEGHVVSPQGIDCAINAPSCLSEHGVYGTLSVYQPASREAELQWIEGALALAVALGAGGLAVWRLRPR